MRKTHLGMAVTWRCAECRCRFQFQMVVVVDSCVPSCHYQSLSGATEQTRDDMLTTAVRLCRGFRRGHLGARREVGPRQCVEVDGWYSWPSCSPGCYTTGQGEFVMFETGCLFAVRGHTRIPMDETWFWP
jgi:hypothetical protein